MFFDIVLGVSPWTSSALSNKIQVYLTENGKVFSSLLNFCLSTGSTFEEDVSGNDAFFGEELMQVVIIDISASCGMKTDNEIFWYLLFRI